MLLPPIGTPLAEISGDILTKMQLLKQEARLVRGPYEEMADVCRSYFQYGAAEPPEDGIVVCNDIQNDVIVQTDIQTKEPPSISFEPEDTGEPAELYLDPAQVPPQLAGQFQQAELSPQSTEQGIEPPTALSGQSAALAQQAVRQGLLPASALIAASASEREDLFQKVFDAVMARSDGDVWFREHALWNNVDGWAIAAFEFDDQAKRFVFTNKSVKEVFADPTNADESRWAYAIVDFPYDAEMAKNLNPEFSDEIEVNADQTGRIVRPPETLDMGGQFEDVSSFQRPMVTLTECFLRDQEIFLRADEAIAGGHAHQRTIGTGDWTPGPDGQLIQEQRQALFSGSDPDDQNAQEMMGPGHPTFEGAEGADPLATAAARASWPTRRCIRHITMIATRSVVLADRECAYWDFPLALNVCIPVLGKPYGIGEPWRHRAKADGRTRLLTNAVNNTDWFKAPVTWGPASAREQFEEEYADAFMSPGRHLWIPDDLILKTNGKPMGTQDPPALPPALLLLDDKLKREINDDSGNMAAIQGQPAASMGQMSGVAIGMVQTGAASLASFKAQRMAHVVERLARLGRHALLTRLSAQDVFAIVKKYPIHVLEKMWTRLGQDEMSVKVELAAGSGATKQARSNDALNKQRAGVISMQTTRERTGEDHPLEEKRIDDETLQGLQMKAQVQQAMAPPPQQAAPPQPAAASPRAGNLPPSPAA